MRRPGTDELWVACRDAGLLAVVDGASLSPESLSLGDAAPVALAIDGDGTVVVVADARGARLGLVDARGRRFLRWIDLAPAVEPGADATPSDVIVEPRGHYAYVSLVHADAIAVVDLVDGTLRGAFPTGHAPGALAWTWLSRYDLMLDPRFR